MGGHTALTTWMMWSKVACGVSGDGIHLSRLFQGSCPERTFPCMQRHDFECEVSGMTQTRSM
jgi:hypothetical protein